MRQTFHVLLAASLLSLGATARAELICFGPALFESAITFDPRVQLLVTVSNCESMLDAGKIGRLYMHIGGEPLMFEGPLYPDGVHEHATPAAARSGDVERFKFEFLEGDRMAFEIDFQNAQGESYGGIRRTVLACRAFTR